MTTDLDRATALVTVTRPVVVIPCLARAKAPAAAPCLEDGRRLPPISST
ncbi:hypothetical protein [Actinomycetospora callitridis]|nr:hypothetical protein [Actinomycetospora callitridis]MDD7920180.1 hypothetical protein [Actinomycetospora callitridis]